VEGIGQIQFDIAYGGAFYAIVEADQYNLKLEMQQSEKLIQWGRKIKEAIIEKFAVKHPFEEDLSFLYGTIFTAKAQNPSHHSRNVCIFANGELDRSATGSGVSARAALHYAKGELKKKEKITIESILGSTMEVEVIEETKFGSHKAIIPEVSGTAYFTGKHQFYFDSNDPLKKGFILR